jgi:hypothetical protein
MARSIDDFRADLMLLCGLLFSMVGCVKQSALNDPPVPSNASADASSGGKETQGPPIAGIDVDDRTENEAGAEPVSGVPAKAAEVAESNSTQSLGDDASERERAILAKRSNGAVCIDWSDLDLTRFKPIAADFASRMPRWLQSLNGEPVRISGYMRPSLFVTEISQFLLVSQTSLPNFAAGQPIDRVIFVNLKPGTTTNFTESRLIDVVGTIRIELSVLDDGTILGLYYVDKGAIVEE